MPNLPAHNAGDQLFWSSVLVIVHAGLTIVPVESNSTELTAALLPIRMPRGSILAAIRW